MSQFKLVEDGAPTTSGFELRVNVAKHSSVREGEVAITNRCATFGAFDAEITRLIDDLEKVRVEAETRFAEGPYGSTTLLLE